MIWTRRAKNRFERRLDRVFRNMVIVGFVVSPFVSWLLPHVTVGLLVLVVLSGCVLWEFLWAPLLRARATERAEARRQQRQSPPRVAAP